MHLSVPISALLYSITLLAIYIESIRFNQVPSYDNLVCPSTTSWSFGVLPSSLVCAALCEKKSICFNFFYNHKDGSCTGVDNLSVQDPAGCSDDSGGIFFMMMEIYGALCTDDDDCKPTDNNNMKCGRGTCKCTDFYNLLSDKRGCVAECPNGFGDTWQVYEDIVLGSFDLLWDYMPLEDCKDWCLTHADCHSIDFNADRPCFLNNGSVLSDGAFLVDCNNCSLYTRDCAGTVGQ